MSAMTEPKSLTDRAGALAHDMAVSAATWIAMGDLTDAQLLDIVHDIGTPVHDALDPHSPLSGEWADDLGMHGLADALGIDRDDTDTLDEAANAFLDTYYGVWWEQIDRMAVAEIARRNA